MTVAVWVHDSLLRSGCDVLDVAGGGRLDLDLTNSVVGAAGALVHGHGRAAERSSSAPSLKIGVRGSAFRVAGGLIQLESTPGEPELPLAEITVRDSILATTPDGAPLLRVDGQENLDDLRDRVRWEGHGVAYHQIDIYRRDQSTRPGTAPQPFRRPDWNVAVGADEEAPFHSELKFVTPWDESRPLWTLVPEDFHLDAQSPRARPAPSWRAFPRRLNEG